MTNGERLIKAIEERDVSYLTSRSVGSCMTCAVSEECDYEKVMSCSEGFLEWLDKEANE